MIMVGMSDDQCIGGVMRQRPEVRQSIETNLLWVHPRIQHDAVFTAFEEIGIGTDLAAAGEVTESHVEKVLGKRERETRP